MNIKDSYRAVTAMYMKTLAPTCQTELSKNGRSPLLLY